MSMSSDARCASPSAAARRRRTHLASRLLPAALLVAACSQGVQEDSALGPSSEIVSDSNSATLSQDLTTPSYLYPSKLEIGRGQVSTVPLSALKVKDQSGTADTWTRYLEFTPRSDGLSATFTFTLPDTVDAAQIGSLTLQANYKGSVASVMRWGFELYDAARGSWVPATDNQDATNWTWTGLTSAAQSASARFVSGSRQLKVRMSTASAADSCDLDYLALSFVRTSQTETVMPPPPPPPPPPSSSSSSSSSPNKSSSSSCVSSSSHSSSWSSSSLSSSSYSLIHCRRIDGSKLLTLSKVVCFRNCPMLLSFIRVIVFFVKKMKRH